jgi:hypothetical protein
MSYDTMEIHSIFGVGGKNHGIRKIGKMNPYFLEYSENLGRG